MVVAVLFSLLTRLKIDGFESLAGMPLGCKLHSTLRGTPACVVSRKKVSICSMRKFEDETIRVWQTPPTPHPFKNKTNSEEMPDAMIFFINYIFDLNRDV